MGDKIQYPEVQPQITREEFLQNQWDQKYREIKISRTRAGVVRNQVLKAYELIEDIRLDYLGDTAFRDMRTYAMRGLESMLNDFLLSDSYWEKRKDEHRKMSTEEYDKYLKQPTV